MMIVLHLTQPEQAECIHIQTTPQHHHRQWGSPVALSGERVLIPKSRGNRHVFYRLVLDIVVVVLRLLPRFFGASAAAVRQFEGWKAEANADYRGVGCG